MDGEHSGPTHAATPPFGIGVNFYDTRAEKMTLSELAAFYDALAAAKEAFGAHITDNRVKFGACEDTMIDFEDALRKWIDGVVATIHARRSSTNVERDLRNDILIRHELNCGTDMAGVAQLAMKLAVENFN